MVDSAWQIPLAATGIDPWAGYKNYYGAQKAAADVSQSQAQAGLWNAQAQGFGIENQYKPQQLEAGIANTQAQTGLATAQAGKAGEETRWVGPLAQSEIGLRGAQAGLATAQAGKAGEETRWVGPLAQSEIGLRGAQAGLAGGQAGLAGAQTANVKLTGAYLPQTLQAQIDLVTQQGAHAKAEALQTGNQALAAGIDAQIAQKGLDILNGTAPGKWAPQGPLPTDPGVTPAQNPNNQPVPAASGIAGAQATTPNFTGPNGVILDGVPVPATQATGYFRSADKPSYLATVQKNSAVQLARNISSVIDPATGLVDPQSWNNQVKTSFDQGLITDKQMWTYYGHPELAYQALAGLLPPEAMPVIKQLQDRATESAKARSPAPGVPTIIPAAPSPVPAASAPTISAADAVQSQPVVGSVQGAVAPKVVTSTVPGGATTIQNTATPAGNAAAEAGVKQVTSFQDGMVQKADAAQQSNALIQQALLATNGWTSGAFADHKMDILKTFDSVRQNINSMLGSEVMGQPDQSVGNWETFNKDTLQAAAAALKAATQRETNYQFSTFQKAFPSDTTTPQGIQQIYNQIAGINDWMMAKSQAAAGLSKTDPNAIKFDSDWNQKVAPEAFILNRLPRDQRLLVIANLQKTPEGKSILASIGKTMDILKANNLAGHGVPSNPGSIVALPPPSAP